MSTVWEILAKTVTVLFVDSIVLIPPPDWSNELSKFENVKTQFESVFECRTMIGVAKLTRKFVAQVRF